MMHNLISKLTLLKIYVLFEYLTLKQFGIFTYFTMTSELRNYISIVLNLVLVEL